MSAYDRSWKNLKDLKDFLPNSSPPPFVFAFSASPSGVPLQSESPGVRVRGEEISDNRKNLDIAFVFLKPPASLSACPSSVSVCHCMQDREHHSLGIDASESCCSFSAQEDEVNPEQRGFRC